MKEISLYLVRHGQTEWNVKEQMQGSQNSPLTQDGIAGAQLTGKYLRQTPFMQAYSSPQQRAVETLSHIVDQFATPINLNRHPGLQEMDFGIWEGLTAPMLAQYPEFDIFLNDPQNYDPIRIKGEAYLQVLERMQHALDHIVDSAPQSTGNILVVSHGAALRLLLCVLNGDAWYRHRDDVYCPRLLNTSISIVNYQQLKSDQKGTYSVKSYNDISHL